MGAPGPSHLGTRETANPNRTIPEFLTFRLYHRLTGSNPQLSITANALIQRARWNRIQIGSDIRLRVLKRGSSLLVANPEVTVISVGPSYPIESVSRVLSGRLVGVKGQAFVRGVESPP